MVLKNSEKKYNSRISKKEKTSIPYVKILSLVGVIISLSLFVFFQLFTIYETKNLHSNEGYNYENTISLLAVHEAENGTIVSGSTIPLDLKITKGTGKIYVNLDSYSEIDTQISITNSNQVVCNLLELPCEQFDFFYSFDDSTLILKGPSASTSIATLTYATINHIPLKNDFVLTGSLNSNGIIGMVGGVEKKVEVAKKLNFEKVFIPFNGLNTSIIEEKSTQNFEIVEVLDIISLLQETFNQNIQLNTQSFNIDEYKYTMRDLSDVLCNYSYSYLGDLSSENNSLSKVNSSLEQLNKSKIARKNQEYYSQGSFCYSANLGLKNELNLQNINLLENLEENIENQQNTIDKKIKFYDSPLATHNLETLNDIYVYLLVKNRLYESKELLNNSISKLEELKEFNMITNESQNLTQKEINISKERIFNQSIQQLSFSQERYKTVLAWESLFKKTTSKKTKLSKNKAQEICSLQISQINVLNQLLKQYEINIFDNSIEKLQNLSSQDSFRCVYTSLELKGRMNSIIGAITLENSDEDFEAIITQFEKIAEQRIQFHSQGEIPLIPYVYYEYSKSLKKTKDYQSAMQYIHASLSFSELNILLDENKVKSNTPIKFEFLSNKEKQLKNLQLLSYCFLVIGILFAIFTIKQK